jgi:outer membrane immunogenic protein
MGTKFWSGVGVLASIVAGVGAASAADMAVKAPVYKAPPVILSDWAGFYIGVEGGFGWADDRLDIHTGNNVKPRGGLFGGYAGYNWQFGSTVIGVEGDFDGADIKAVDAGFFQHKTNELASARARLGYVVAPNLLAFGTAGAGWGHTKVTGTLSGVTAGSLDQFGWVAGAGLEYKLWGPLIGRVEYLHYDFANKGLVFGTDNLKETVDVLKGGVSYKF